MFTIVAWSACSRAYNQDVQTNVLFYVSGFAWWPARRCAAEKSHKEGRKSKQKIKFTRSSFRVQLLNVDRKKSFFLPKTEFRRNSNVHCYTEETFSLNRY